MEDRSNSYYRHLTRNMVLIVIVVSLTPLVLTAAVLLRQFHESYHSKVLAHLGELVERHSRHIDTFLTDRLSEVRVLARSPRIQDLVDPDLLRRKLTLFREEYGGVVVDLGLIDSDGIQRSYAGPFNLQGADYAQAGWFKEASKGEHYISDVFTGLRGSPHFIVAVRQEVEGQRWILRATIDFEVFNALVGGLAIGRTGFAFILNRKGEFQTKPRFEVLPDRGPYLALLRDGPASRGRTVLEAKNSAGLETIFVTAPIKNGDWLLFCQQERADAMAEFGRAWRLALAIVLVGLGAIVAVAFLLTRRMVSRLAEADRQKDLMGDRVIEAGRLASIGELAAGIAHEINNPVAIMVEEAGWVEDLLEDEEPASAENLAEFKRAVAQIRTQGARCKEITHKLLSFARRTDPQVLEVDLNAVVEEVSGLLRQKSRYANVELITELGADLPPVAASPSELQQVLLNLVNNAVDAINSSGGRVTLKTWDQGGWAMIEVSDTGAGIPQANLARIFDPFFTTKPVGQGTGLGLSICYGIIHKLGGEISVKSEVGSGTTFIIRVPVAGAAGAEKAGRERG